MMSLWQRILHLLTYKVSTKTSSCMIMLVIFATFTLGSGEDDVFADTGPTSEYAFADKGDDVMIYTPSINRTNNRDYYDGGKGVDILWMRMTPKEFQHSAFQADLIRFHYHILNNTHPNLASGYGPSFHFASLNLRVRNFEHIIVQNIASQQVVEVDKNQTVIPAIRFHRQIKDSSIDSMV